MYCCTNTWHIGKSKLSSAKISDLWQETHSFIISEWRTVFLSTEPTLNVRTQWPYSSESPAHLNTRWAKCLRTKSRAEPALTNFYELVDSAGSHIPLNNSRAGRIAEQKIWLHFLAFSIFFFVPRCLYKMEFDRAKPQPGAPLTDMICRRFKLGKKLYRPQI